jgi:hypothetical protein
MTGKTLSGFVVAAVLGIGFAGTGRAAPITWEFEGRVEIVGVAGNLPVGTAELAAMLTSLGVEVGATVTGSVRYESSTPDDRPEASNARYSGAILNSEAIVGSYRMAGDLFEGDPSFHSREIFAGTFPESGISAYFTQSHLGDEIGLLSRFGLMGLELSSHDPSFFAPETIGLPLDPPALQDLDPFGFDETSAFGYGSAVFFGVSTDIGSFTVRASLSRLERVPEPELTLLLAGAGLALAALRRRAS